VAGQEVFVSRDTSGVAALFGRHVLRFSDELSDPQIPNPFAYRVLPSDAVNQRLVIQFDFRTLRPDTKPRLSISGQGWNLFLAPQLQMAGGEALAQIEPGKWHRLLIDVPRFDRSGGELELQLAQLVDGAWRNQVKTKTALRIDPSRVEQGNNLFLGFAPSANQPLGGMWDMDNLEVRLLPASEAK
jgi:hypothetical protein